MLYRGSTVTTYEELQISLKTWAVRSTRTVTVELKSPQRPFSDYKSLPEVCHLYGISYQQTPELNVLQPFDCSLGGNEVLNEESEAALTQLTANLELM